MPRNLTLEQHKASKLARVDKQQNGCWIWNGSLCGRMGYGQTQVHKKSWLTHRLFYTWYKGEIPQGMFVLHKCDVPACVNPDHLFLGDAEANAKDMVSKRRNKHGDGIPLKPGEENQKAKLKNQEVLQIRAMYKPQEFGFKRISKIYGVSKNAISNIVRRKTWQHI